MEVSGVRRSWDIPTIISLRLRSLRSISSTGFLYLSHHFIERVAYSHKFVVFRIFNVIIGISVAYLVAVHNNIK